MTDGISINVRGVDKLKAFLDEVPRGTKREAIQAAADYLIGDNNHGLKYEPERVIHGDGNPYQWTSEKQRRAFFATDGFGRGIPSQRTHHMVMGWRANPTNDGYRMEITNTVDYATYVQGNQIQPGHVADRWRQYGKIIADNTAGAIRAAQQAVDRWIREHRK